MSAKGRGYNMQVTLLQVLSVSDKSVFLHEKLFVMPIDKDKIASLVKRIQETGNVDMVKGLLEKKKSDNSYPGGGRFFRAGTPSGSVPGTLLTVPTFSTSSPSVSYAPVEHLDLGPTVDRTPVELPNPAAPIVIPGRELAEPFDMSKVQPSVPSLDPVADAARRIMEVENSKTNLRGGWNALTQRWYPHRSHEGGADTIAYGIKLSNGSPEAALALKQGYLTDEQAVSAVDSLVRKHYDAAKKVYDKKYGAGEWDKLSDKSQSILVDYSYNPGLAKFPKLMEGFHSGNMDMIRENYKRYSGGKELGRNKTLLKEIDTLGSDYPIFRADGGPIGRSGWNAPLQPLIELAKRKYLTDYVNNGEVYGYPGSEVESSYGSGPNKGIVNYILSPYTGRTHEDNDVSLARRALLSEYTGIKEGLMFDPNDYIEESPYRPKISKDANAKYFRMKERPEASRRSMFDSVAGAYKIDHGIDENGRKYVSFYDLWDLSPFSKDRGINGNDIPGTKPVELYDRIYEDEDPDYYYRVVPEEATEEYRKKHRFVELKFGSGGKIHIKPENRGKFTALKKRTGHSASWFKAHGTPAQKKMAVFALNAKKWKHDEGGFLDRLSEYDPEMILAAIKKIKSTSV